MKKNLYGFSHVKYQRTWYVKRMESNSIQGNSYVGLTEEFSFRQSLKHKRQNKNSLKRGRCRERILLMFLAKSVVISTTILVNITPRRYENHVQKFMFSCYDSMQSQLNWYDLPTGKNILLPLCNAKSEQMSIKLGISDV